MTIALIITTIALILVSYYFQTRLMVNHYRQYSTVSDMYNLPEYRSSFRTGLMYTGMLQIIWILLISSFQNYNFTIGHTIFTCGAFGAILIGLFSKKDNYVIHILGGSLYFFCLSIGAALIAVRDFNQSSFIAIASLIHVIFWFLSIPIFIRKKNGTFAIETIHCLLSYSWIVFITGHYILSNLKFSF